jgi:putative inorganic carbon (hco3(-)) transporter
MTTSFWLYIIYIAFSFLRPIELYFPGLGEYRPMLWLWLAAAIGAVMSALATKQFAGRGVHFGLMFAFVFSMTFGHVAHGYLGGATAALSSFSTSSMLYFLVLLNVTSRDRLRQSCQVLVMSIFVTSVMGVAAYHTGYLADLLVLRQNVSEGQESPDGIGETSDTPALDTTGKFLFRVHAEGFLSDPNDFAQAIVMVLPMLALAYIRGRHLQNIVLVFSPALILLYTLYLTHSRGAVIGVMSLLFFGVKKKIGTLRTLLVLIVLLGAVSASGLGGGREVSTKEQSAAERIEAWNTGIQMLRGNPFFGVGYGEFTEYHYLTAHNSFVLCFAELGMVGYYLWISLLVIAFIGLNRGVRLLPPESSECHFSNALRTSLVGFITCAWFLSRTYQPVLYLLIALCVACWHSGLSIVQHQQFVEYTSPIRWKWWTSCMVIVSLTAVYGFILFDRVSG